MDQSGGRIRQKEEGVTVNKEKALREPDSQPTTMADKAGFERSSHNQPTADQRPAFQTALGYVLWDIHSGKYPDRLVPHADAAEIARLKVSTFTTMRSRKAGPPYVRLFGTPYYDLVDLIRWIEEKMEFSRV